MERNEIIVRVAAAEDAEELLKIYRPYVEETAITFEYEVPSVEEFAGRIRETLQKYPYLVAVRKGELLGYAYVSPFKMRAAYDWGVETSIYVKMDCKRMGVGKHLYEKLEEVMKAQNILNMNACIGYPEVEDEHLTKDSVKFHETLGYQMVGEFHKCGYKFNRWYNMVWMEKIIGEHVEQQEPVKRFAQVQAGIFG